jgi:hypothetical protein
MRAGMPPEVMDELRQVVSRLGWLTYEDAYWILVPRDEASDVLWVRARGGGGQLTSMLASRTRVMYSPTPEECEGLLRLMGGMAYVLHIHNHPDVAGMSVSCAPSPADWAFARQWRSTVVEMRASMRFFVARHDELVEYDPESGEVRRWLGHMLIDQGGAP